MVSANYDGDNIPQSFAPAGGGNRTTDGYSTVRINNLPQAISFENSYENNSSRELWVIDDVVIEGTPTVPCSHSINNYALKVEQQQTQLQLVVAVSQLRQQSHLTVQQ